MGKWTNMSWCQRWQGEFHSLWVTLPPLGHSSPNLPANSFPSLPWDLTFPTKVKNNSISSGYLHSDFNEFVISSLESWLGVKENASNRCSALNKYINKFIHAQGMRRRSCCHMLSAVWISSFFWKFLDNLTFPLACLKRMKSFHSLCSLKVKYLPEARVFKCLVPGCGSCLGSF